MEIRWDLMDFDGNSGDCDETSWISTECYGILMQLYGLQWIFMDFDETLLILMGYRRVMM